MTPKSVSFTYNADSSPDTITRYDGPTTAPVLVDTTLYQKSTDGSGSGYDGMGRLTNMQQIFSSASDDYSYVYDAAGNITQMSSTADGTETYTYDAANELQSVTAPPSPTRATPTTPTAIARRRTTTRKPAQPGRITSCCSMGRTTTSTNAEGNRTAKFEYWEGADFKGSTVPEGATDITLYTWDYRDRLTQETMESTYGKRTEVVVYTYDYANRQIGRFDYIYGYGWPKSSSETQTVYDGQNPYLEVSVPTLGINIPTSGDYSSAKVPERYLYAKAVDQVLATDNCAGTVLWGLADQEGTIRNLVNNSGTLVTRAREIQQLRRADRRHGGRGRLPVRVRRDAVGPVRQPVRGRRGALQSVNRPAPPPRPDRLRLRHDEPDGLVRQRPHRPDRSHREKTPGRGPPARALT